MTYSECTDRITSVLGRADFEDIDDCSLQFNIIGIDSGVFYIDIRDHIASLSCEEKKGYKVKYVITLPVLARILDKTVDPVYAYTTGKFKMMGDVALGRHVLAKITKL